MKLPFTKEQFLEVFKDYNTTVFPMQLFLLLFAGFVIYRSIQPRKNGGSIILLILAALWAWMGIVYHISFFASINKAAYVFGGLFLLESILLLIYNFTASPTFSFTNSVSGIFSAVLLMYALIIYPLLGYIGGHGYPYLPTFGTPCSTTIFTIAIFLLARNRLPFYILIIPLIWTLIGFSAAFTLGIYEDIGLIVAGLIFTVLNFTKLRTWLVRKKSFD